MVRIGKKKRKAELTRGGTECSLSAISPEIFRERFGSPPTLPKSGLSFEKITCSHMAVFLAGVYVCCPLDVRYF